MGTMRSRLFTIFLALGLALPAPAAISLVQKAQASNSNTPSVSASFASTPGLTNAVIVGVVSNGASCGMWTVSDNQSGKGNAYARLMFGNDGCGSGATNEASIWCATVVSASGTFTVTTAQAGNTFATIFIFEYSGLSCNGDQVTFGVNAASPYTCGGPVTTNNANDLLIIFLSLNASGTAAATPSAGFTTQQSQTNPSFEIGFYADQVVSSTGTFSPQWTSATTPFHNIPCTFVAVKAASGGGGGGGQAGYPTLR